MSLQIFAHPAWGIEVDKQRTVYFADISHNGRGTVWKLTRDGTLTALLKDFHAHSVNLDSDGRPVTAHGEERDNRLVRILNATRSETLFMSQDWDRFFGGNSFYSKKGNIYFGMKNIWQVHPKGNTRKFNDHTFEWIQSIYIDDEEKAYAVDKAVLGGALYRLSNEGSAEILAQDLISASPGPVDLHNVVATGITKGCDGKMYVTESVGRRVVKINDDGTSETFYRSADDWFPTGIDMFAGDMYVLEYKNNGIDRGPRITKIDELGKISVLVEVKD
ncbi:MAG: hypothetical protein DWQ43_06350 [Acidobacteria bacterium]|nr:MAG: hypothetical protein DWQ38_11475 [Acidobacteriota bacterium]REK13243.1 MAG: hypothetical protein DWQ43_06350 [Acidobacteriota bacterium]